MKETKPDDQLQGARARTCVIFGLERGRGRGRGVGSGKGLLRLKKD